MKQIIFNNLLWKLSRTSSFKLFRCEAACFSQMTNVVAEKRDAPLKEVRKKRNELFSKEKLRLLNLTTKVDKITVRVHEPPVGMGCELKMNKNSSTPFDCAKHISEMLIQYAALALVNGKPWDMHRPLLEDCDLKFLFFTDADPLIVNQAYWRSCSFILGYILETAFKDNYSVTLHSWPSANYHTGSFVYDVKLNLNNWNPTQDELKVLSKVPTPDLRSKNLPFERMETDIAVAEKIFENNPFKLEQLRYMAQDGRTDKRKICLYRVGDHVDISIGPMISNTNQLGFYSVTAIYPFQSEDFGAMYRVQGVSVPFTQHVNSWTWEIVTNAAKRKNEMPLPTRQRYMAQIKK